MAADAVVGWSVFETALGRCGVAWSGAGFVAAVLPGEGEEDAGVTLSRRYGSTRRAAAPPPGLAAVVGRLQRHLEGHPDRFDDVPLDLGDATPFTRAVYEAVRRVPPGRVATYGGIARELGRPGAARAVGAALARNPLALLVPCHRAIAADGGLTGFSAPGGTATKRRLLELEGWRHAAAELPLALRPRPPGCAAA